jgi:CRISPR-associated endoribonuclease Cas6
LLYYELVVTILLQTDLEAEKGYEYLSRLISNAMLSDRQLKELHGQKSFKGYSFSNLYPREADKVYRQGRVYIFHIRSLELELLLKLKYLLAQGKIGVVATEIKNYTYRPISQLKSLTPVVATVNNRSWTKENGLKLLMERAHINCLKKYRAFIGHMDEPAEIFIESIQLTNEKPIKIPYKSNSFLGHKLLIGVKTDPLSQKLAFTALGAGLLEKNSVGMGYCMYE